MNIYNSQTHTHTQILKWEKMKKKVYIYIIFKIIGINKSKQKKNIKEAMEKKKMLRREETAK